ncbi:MAG: response regulator receiver protein [Oceanicaulis sp.]|jgi:DNA-binding response OmpR family regulator|uniref:transcriptional regulator n=1 Tax=unclassified Oceanicaulis TaxID=2632123 RepID=UPI000066D41A|nr:MULTISPECIES: transcriptional regulator [unclassified Oceanicaulis]EAP91034.1 response regulator receiver [Oceanicaulis sp. HTCC2633]MAB70601.1 response regulator receiver protein [Oceanicaulis sp.]MBC39608.1 response regulator receiver protein [Oceanicaulis sp.]MBG35642.1 response regulator receiver protein [Oceanicaulis sp.]HCR93664.1 response regulator receiver protein [Oceanicaulis sp.]|tara:strand:+ start:892 stop:1896 length:1005 start_codon:yes stop_codon:yes gene_type:complete
MSEIDYSRASVALYDPVSVNQRTTRYSLHEIGFRDIFQLNTLSELRRIVQDDAPHLIIAETADHEAEVFRLVRAIRSGELSNNPFVALLLTSWRRDADLVRNAIGCGADDLLIRPLSNSFVEDRIRTLIRARKPFIVTSDYIGPDRRRDKERGAGAVKPIEAPNVLKAVVTNDIEALQKAHAWIDEAQRTVEGERLRRLCMRIIVGAEAGMREMKVGRQPAIDLSEFENSARELRARMAKFRSSEASRVAKALVDVSQELREQAGLTHANLSLAKELSMAAYVAYAGDDGMERSQEEMAKAAEALQRRMAAASKRKIQVEGGAPPEAELKRAAN